MYYGTFEQLYVYKAAFSRYFYTYSTALVEHYVFHVERIQWQQKESDTTTDFIVVLV